MNKLGARARIWIHNMKNHHAQGHAYMLNFRCTNNMDEYEALLLGLKLIKSLGETKISILGDSDLTIQQMKGNFVTNYLRLRAYRGQPLKYLTPSQNPSSPKFQESTIYMHIAWQPFPTLASFLLSPTTILLLKSNIDLLSQIMSKIGKCSKMIHK